MTRGVLTLLTVLFIININVSNAHWLGVIKHNPEEAGNEHCYTALDNIGSLKLKEQKQLSSKCAIAKCTDNKDILITGCTIMRVSPPCKLVEGDISKPFPHCCYDLICPESDNNNL